MGDGVDDGITNVCFISAEPHFASVSILHSPDHFWGLPNSRTQTAHQTLPLMMIRVTSSPARAAQTCKCARAHLHPNSLIKPERQESGCQSNSVSIVSESALTNFSPIVARASRQAGQEVPRDRGKLAACTSMLERSKTLGCVHLYDHDAGGYHWQ